MSIRWRNGRPIVEIYDAGKKQHVKPADYGMERPPANAPRRTLERWARRLEAKAVAARDERHPTSHDETCDSFAWRWANDFDGHSERGRSESTRKLNGEQVSRFGKEFARRTLRSSAAKPAPSQRRTPRTSPP